MALVSATNLPVLRSVLILVRAVRPTACKLLAFRARPAGRLAPLDPFLWFFAVGPGPFSLVARFRIIASMCGCPFRTSIRCHAILSQPLRSVGCMDHGHYLMSSTGLHTVGWRLDDPPSSLVDSFPFCSSHCGPLHLLSFLGGSVLCLSRCVSGKVHCRGRADAASMDWCQTLLDLDLDLLGSLGPQRFRPPLWS